MNYESYISARRFLETTETLSLEDSFSYIKSCSSLLCCTESEHLGRDLIIRALEKKDKFYLDTHKILNDLIDVAGLHPYVEPHNLSTSSAIRREFFTSRVLDAVLHEEQMNLSLKLQSSQSVILSAPTSFGKSMLIEEIVASMKYKNVVIVQPTLALLDETRKKLLRYKSSYDIIVSTSQPPSDRGNLFLFTAERVVEYKEFNTVDFFVIDEFYKLSMDRNDDRAGTLNLALYKLLRLTHNFYFLGPNVDKIPDGFTEKYKALWYRTDFATVAVDRISIKEHSENRLFELLMTLEEPTLIYCSTPEKATKLMANYVEFAKEHLRIVSSGNSDIIEWVEENVYPEWDLVRCLSFGVACHHGTLPRHLSSSIVDAFNNGTVKYLFCTSTLIEGVNTAAKNLVLYDKKKGPKSIDFFDYKNISGRAGRMMRYYVGKIYEFHEVPSEKEVNVDIPVFTQTTASIELLVQLEDKDVKESVAPKLSSYKSLDIDIQNLLRKNVGVTIEGQLSMIKYLEANLESSHSQLSWTGHPSYEQLEKTLELVWNYLASNGEKTTPRSHKQLAYMTNRYLITKSIGVLISDEVNSSYWIDRIPERHIRTQQAVLRILRIVRNWFNFSLPRYLNVVNTLQTYVYSCRDLVPGNYSFFTATLESSFVSPQLAMLIEFDIPPSAIQKLSPVLGTCKTLEEIMTKLSRINLEGYGLLKYERSKLLRLLFP